MDLIREGLSDAFRLLVELDASVMSAAGRSVLFSLIAVGLATLVGVPIAILLAGGKSFASRATVQLFRAGMAFPTVFIGVVCFALFSRRGPLGVFEILYTPSAVIFGEFLLALPLVVSISHGAIASLDRRVQETAMSLGAGPLLRCRTYLSEARVGVLMAVLTAFSRCITELGIAMMVGGNIKDRTRTLATATALETGKGEFGRGLAMSLILFAVAVTVAAGMIRLSRERRTDD